jgi:ATP-dependent Clp protease protease subunit
MKKTAQQQMRTTNSSPKPKDRTLILGEDVNQESVGDLIKSIYEINMDDEEKELTFVDYERPPIHLILNTYGGSVYDGLALIGAIELSTTPVVTTCLGSAMSMGLFILSSGHHRRAHHLSTIMFHQISSYSWDKIEGIKKDLEEANRLETVCESLLLARTKIKQSDLNNHKKAKSEWYMTAQEALKMGIIDEIIGSPLISKEKAMKEARERVKNEKAIKELEKPAVKRPTKRTPVKKRTK